MKSTFKVLFYLKRDKLKADGTAPVWCRITVDGQATRYQSKGDGVEVRVQDGTIWLSQKNIGLLFDTSIDNIGLHLKNIFSVVQQEVEQLKIFSTFY